MTLRRHPLAPLSDGFTALRLETAAQVNSARHPQPIRTTGIVTCRQRPSTASGVTFVTLEDETGAINVVVWRATAEKYRRELLGSTLLTVYDHVERVETSAVPVVLVHLIASKLADQSQLLGDLTVASRDFRPTARSCCARGGPCADRNLFQRAHQGVRGKQPHRPQTAFGCPPPGSRTAQVAEGGPGAPSHMRFFLDADVLVSAAYLEKSDLLAVFELAQVGIIQLTSSAFAIEEGRRNVA